MTEPSEEQSRQREFSDVRRAQFAAFALQGLLCNPTFAKQITEHQVFAANAVAFADALIAELDKRKRRG